MASSLLIQGELSLPGDELRWTAVRAGGPGGQNVNKVSSKVELRFDVVGSTLLDAGTKQRLSALAGHKMDKEGVLLVVCQESRDQRKNLEQARERLAALVRAALVVPRLRRKTKVSKGATERRLAVKRLVASKKANRRPDHD